MAQINALWQTTFTDPGHHLHPGRCSLRDQQVVPSRRTSISPPRTVAPYSSTRMPQRVTSRARRNTSLARTGTPHWAVDGMVVTGKFRTAPDPSCSHFTVANIHIDKECAKRRSVCIAFLCLIRDLCSKLSALILTCDFNTIGERELPAGASDCQRRISPLQAAFNHANIPWPASGATPLWGPGGEPRGGTWLDCCGFVVLPDSQSQRLMMRHGSSNVDPASIGLRPEDQTWHDEQRFYGTKGGGKTRLQPTPSHGRRLCCTPTSERPASYALLLLR